MHDYKGTGSVTNESAVICVEDVSKSYKLYHSPAGRLLETLNSFLRVRRKNRRSEPVTFQAVANVSLAVKRGETVAIIGRNGSGKSTLLQIISGTLMPTTGSVTVNGNVAAILELGAGFSPEYTGRENAALNASLFGVSSKDLPARLDKIEEFAEIGEFFDQPVRSYSSGMYARLAFAVGITLNPEIFIIDEALSVGDAFFQAKCVAALDKFRSAGGTVLLVTHDMHAVSRMCDRGIVLNHGRVLFDGNVGDAVNIYYKLGSDTLRGAKNTRDGFALTGPAVDSVARAKRHVDLRRHHVTGNGDAYIEWVAVYDETGTERLEFGVNEWVHMEVFIKFLRDVPSFDIGVGIRDRTGILIGGAHTYYKGMQLGSAASGEYRRLAVQIKLSVMPGDYLVLIGIAKNYSEGRWVEYYSLWDAFCLRVSGHSAFWGLAELDGKISVLP